MTLTFTFSSQLISPPVNTQALASMSSVAGEALTGHLADILPALLRCISEATDEQHVCIISTHVFPQPRI